MKVVIDTCSMLSLVRYYLPFDKEIKLFNLIHDKVRTGEIILLDRVIDESSTVASGTIVKTMPFVSDRKNQKSTAQIFPDRFFFQMLEDDFVNKHIRRKLSHAEFENDKYNYLKSGDVKIILYCLSIQNAGEDIIVVTEETANSNDKKTFKKIPAICRILGIESMTLPQLIETYPEIDLRF